MSLPSESCLSCLLTKKMRCCWYCRASVAPEELEFPCSASSRQSCYLRVQLQSLEVFSARKAWFWDAKFLCSQPLRGSSFSRGLQRLALWQSSEKQGSVWLPPWVLFMSEYVGTPMVFIFLGHLKRLTGCLCIAVSPCSALPVISDLTRRKQGCITKTSLYFSGFSAAIGIQR